MLVANWVAATLCVVLALAVLVKQNKKNTDYFLLASILGFAAYPISDIWTNYTLNHWSFAFHALASYAMFSPFFLYAMLLISRKHRVEKSWFWFLAFHISYFLFVILDVFILFDYGQEEVRRLYYGPTPNRLYIFFYKGLQLYTIGLLIWFLSKLRIYQRRIQDYYSNLEAVRLDWLKYFTWIYILSYSTAFLAHLAYNFRLVSDIRIPYLLTSVAIALSLLWMFYQGLRQHALANFSEPAPQSGNAKKYASSSLSNESANELFASIKELFDKERIFHNPDLKVQDIAGKLGVTNHNVSQVLNEIAGKSFYEFVNDYRLGYFKEQLADPEKRRYTILALGMESGFNSKASINRVFKQQLGLTPKEYQQQMLAS